MDMDDSYSHCLANVHPCTYHEYLVVVKPCCLPNFYLPNYNNLVVYPLRLSNFYLPNYNVILPTRLVMGRSNQYKIVLLPDSPAICSTFYMVICVICSIVTSISILPAG